MGIFISHLQKKDIHKIASSCRFGTFEYLFIPFVFINAPSIFYRVINQGFFYSLDSCVVVYLDDILLFSCTKEDHESNLNAVFERL